MQKTVNLLRKPALRFKHFSRKGYALFSCLGREVLICILSVSTLSHSRADGISVVNNTPDETLSQKEQKLDEVIVTGSRAPLTESEAAKIVSVITRDDIERMSAETVNDVLKIATGVDVRQRGGFGVQTDISIGGGTFDQIAILLNGVNISNPQTGHLSADFPVTLDDIQRIEVIKGAAARVYGAGAFNGAINIVTQSPVAEASTSQRQSYSPLVFSLEGGSYGTFGLSARGEHHAGKTTSLANSLSASYKQSDGAVRNSYFRKSTAYYQGGTAFRLQKSSTEASSLSWSLGLSTMRYGANTFYSAAYPDQYESNARIFANVKADLAPFSGSIGKTIHLMPSLYWNRNYDHFQLIRHSTKGENFHRNDVTGASLNAYCNWLLGRTSAGFEIRREKIWSTNLGTPMQEEDHFKVPHYDVDYTKSKARTDVSLFLEHNILLKDFTASLGVMANKNTGYNDSYRFYPGIDMSYRPGDRWKVTASWNMAFRMPTFTDLFYKSPTQEGNIGLKPENTTSLRLGGQYRATGIMAQAGAFYDWGTDMIDWVMYSSDDIYHSANFKLDNRGFDADVDILPQEWNNAFFISKIHVGYAFTDQKRHDDVNIYKSNYAMEYLRHKLIAIVDHKVYSRLFASWQFRWQERMGSYILYVDNKSTGIAHPYSPYALLDAKLCWKERHYELSLSLNNITNTHYYDIGNVEQPGFWLMAAAKIRL